MKTIPFTIASKNVNGLYKEHYKLLMKEIEEDYRKWRHPLDPCISPYTNINSKWIKHLNIRPQTLKLIQERVGNTLGLVGIGKNFLNGTPVAQQLRESTDKWDFIKL
jgi:hypothetical protein